MGPESGRARTGPAKLGVDWGVGRNRFRLPPAELGDTKGSCWGWVGGEREGKIDRERERTGEEREAEPGEGGRKGEEKGPRREQGEEREEGEERESRISRGEAAWEGEVSGAKDKGSAGEGGEAGGAQGAGRELDPGSSFQR